MKLVVYLIYIFIILYFLYKKREQDFVVTVLLGIILLPSLNFGSLYISISYLISLILLFKLLTFRRINTLADTEPSVYFLSNVFFLIFSMIGWLFNARLNSSSIIPFLGSIQNLFILLCLYLVISVKGLSFRKIFESFVQFLLIANLVVVFLQIFVPRLITPILYDLYFKPSLPVYASLLEFVEKFGFTSRMFGLFPTPLYLGAIMLLIFAYKLPSIFYEKRWKDKFQILIALICGFSSLSKMFILGVILIIFIQIITLLFYGIKRKIFDRLVVYLSFLIASSICMFLILSQTKFSSYLFYYFSFIFKPFEALKVRYTGSGEDLFLAKTYELIYQYPFFGVGSGIFKDEFVGDSTYVTIIHNSGFMGFLSFVILIIILSLSYFRKKQVNKIMVLTAFIIISLGLNTIFLNVTFIPFVLFLLISDKFSTPLKYEGFEN